MPARSGSRRRTAIQTRKAAPASPIFSSYTSAAASSPATWRRVSSSREARSTSMAASLSHWPRDRYSSFSLAAASSCPDSQPRIFSYASIARSSSPRRSREKAAALSRSPMRSAEIVGQRGAALEQIDQLVPSLAGDEEALHRVEDAGVAGVDGERALPGLDRQLRPVEVDPPRPRRARAGARAARSRPDRRSPSPVLISARRASASSSHDSYSR